MKSLVSAMASTSVLETPGFTFAVHDRGTVNPPIFVLLAPAELSTKKLLFFPAFTLLMETTSLVPGISAQFVPFTKKAKMSLNWLFTNCGYSADPNT